MSVEAARQPTPADPTDTTGRSRSVTILAARFVLGAATALTLIASIWYRCVDLGNVPGINGDEAWYGVQMESMLASEPFQWLTPTRLPLNPIHVGPLALLLKAFGPAFWVLRAPALATGLLLLPLAYLLLSKVMDRFTALLATLLLAAHPALIAYARFGWDASHSPSIGLLILYFALRGREFVTFAALMVALVVHPTNVFLTPVAVLVLLAVQWVRGDCSPTTGVVRWLLVSRDRWLAFGAAALGVFGVSIALLGKPLTPGSVMRFLADFGHLLAGPSIYEYIAGPIGDRVTFTYDVLAWGLGLSLATVGTRRMARRERWELLAIGAGVLLGAGAICTIGGPESIRPHFERYGLFLIVPSVVYLSCCLRTLIPSVRRVTWLPRGSGVLALTLVVCWSSLWGLQRYYFDVFQITGGSSHPTFRTAAIEPKARALAIILQDLASSPVRPPSGAGRPVPIITDGWWLYWPIRFLADEHRDLLVTDVSDKDVAERAPVIRAALEAGGYAVGFLGEGLEDMIRSSFDPGELRTWDVADRVGRPLIRILRLAPG